MKGRPGHQHRLLPCVCLTSASHLLCEASRTGVLPSRSGGQFLDSVTTLEEVQQ